MKSAACPVLWGNLSCWRVDTSGVLTLQANRVMLTCCWLNVGSTDVKTDELSESLLIDSLAWDRTGAPRHCGLLNYS